MSTNIKDVVAFITGGASGLGKAVAEMIISCGGKVVIADTNDVGSSVAEKLGENALFVRTNVTSEEDIKKALLLTKQKFGKLSVVINSAGIFRKGSIYETNTNQPHSSDKWEEIMSINLFGTFNVIRLAVELMKDNQPDDDNQRGVIINFASVAGYEIPRTSLVYGISKAGIIAMTKPVAQSLGQLGIRVNAIAPGFFDTPMSTDSGSRDYTNLLVNLKRRGRPDELAQLVKCIIENHYINAEVIRIDAGWRNCA